MIEGPLLPFEPTAIGSNTKSPDDSETLAGRDAGAGRPRREPLSESLSVWIFGIPLLRRELPPVKVSESEALTVSP